MSTTCYRLLSPSRLLDQHRNGDATSCLVFCLWLIEVESSMVIVFAKERVFFPLINLDCSVVTMSAIAVRDSAAPLKEGYVLYFDVLQGQWCRVYMSCSAKDLRMSQSSSTVNRTAARPPLLLADIETIYCSVADPSAPARHIPVLGIATLKGELLVLRTAERRSLSDWMAVFDKLPIAPVMPVQDMSTFRASFSSALYAQLFKTDEERIPSFSGGRVSGASGNVMDRPQGHRIASLSAGCPRRAPIRRTIGTILQVMPHHADPASSSNPPSRRQSQAGTPTTAVVPSLLQRKSNSPPAVGATTGRKSGSPPSHGALSITTPPVQSLQMIEKGRSKSRSQENAAPGCSQPGNGSRSRQSSPAPITPATVNVLPSSAKLQMANPLPPPKIKFGPGGDAAPADASSALAAAQIAKLRHELDSLTLKNIDLELDHANVSARVLELEAEGSLLKGSLAEWRRKFASLEQQLEFQERDFNRRLVEEKAALMESLQAEVAVQLKQLKSKWDEREQELLRAAQHATA